MSTSKRKREKEASLGNLGRCRCSVGSSWSSGRVILDSYRNGRVMSTGKMFDDEGGKVT